MRLKNKIFTTIIAFSFLFSISADAQVKYSLGLGYEYNLSTESHGAHGRFYFFTGEHLCFGPEFTIFQKKTIEHQDEKEEISVWEINLNAHYIFEIGERLGAYPIIGVNYTREKEKLIDLNSSQEEENFENIWGVNFGAGLHLPLKKIIPFMEYHFTAGKLDESILTFGFFLHLNGKDEERIND